MKTHPECIPCAFNQIIKMGRLLNISEEIILDIMRDFSRILKDIDFSKPPVVMAREIKKIILEKTGVEDPFYRMKREENKLALSLLPELRRLVEESDDELIQAIRIAIAGNILDAVVERGGELEEVLKKSLEMEFAVFDYGDFKRELNETDTILYISDNAGEIVFDRVLIEVLKKLGKKVIVAVRGEPILNDATLEDAREAGIHEVAELITTGSPYPGTFLNSVSKEFLEIYRNTKLKIAKGQGNFETLSSENGGLYFLFMVKCPVIAKELGVPTGSIILMKSRGGV